MRKLTLNAEAKVIDRAKQIAKLRGTSVSTLFSDFIQSLDAGNPVPTLGVNTRRAAGLIKLPKGKSDRELIEDALTHRHSR